MSGLMHMVISNYNELLEAKKVSLLNTVAIIVVSFFIVHPYHVVTSGKCHDVDIVEIQESSPSKSCSNPLVDSWLFMKSPLPVMSFLVVYLLFVLKIGPEYMKNRKPFELKGVMIAYNAYQVVFSVWLCCHAFYVKNAVPYLLNHTCRNPSPNKEFQEALSIGAWWYFFSKITELLDTVFFVLRKKQSQVTFLHVYHHSITMVGSWGYLKFLPGEQGVVIGFLNSMVHIVMYAYYLIAALGPRFQKYLWWKKYMTWIQLSQFCIMLAYLLFIVVMDCKLPKALTFFFVTNVVIFLYLFSDFYIKAYRRPKKVLQFAPVPTEKSTENCTSEDKKSS